MAALGTRIILLFIVLNSPASGASADPLVLMDAKGKPVSDYNEKLLKIANVVHQNPGRGEEILLPAGKKVRVTHLLHHDGQFFHFELEDGTYLKIRRSRSSYNPSLWMKEFYSIRPLPKSVVLLNSKGRTTKNYNEDIELLGDRLKAHAGTKVEVVLGDKQYTVSRFLGGEAQSKVFELSDGRVLRMRRFRFSFDPIGMINPLSNKKGAYMDGIGDYVKAMERFKKDQTPATRIYPDETDRVNYIVTDKEDFDAEYGDYLQGKDRRGNALSEDALKKLDDDLVVFARKTAKYQTIADLKESSLVHTPEGWKILDASDAETAYANGGGSLYNIFEENVSDRFINMEKGNRNLGGARIVKPGLPNRVKERVLKAIEEERDHAYPAAVRPKLEAGETADQKRCGSFYSKFLDELLNGPGPK